VKSNFVASYSIGIGPFETDGKGLSRLKNFERMGDYISFRDSKSIDLFKKTTNTSKNIILSADPSYILSDWYKRSNEINKEKQCTYKYCFIIREWPYSESGKKMIQCMIDTALSYKKEGQKVIIVSLFGTYDHQIIQKSLALGFEVMIYNLVENSISEFLNKLLMESEFIITSRAHGAWLPIVFGKPVLIVGIENKLDQINANLKNCTHITKATNTHNLKESILNFVENYEILKTNIKHDLNPMVNLAENNKDSFYEWIESNE
jgi:polysaccharide pyruvyl transferase WcaK-like protein